MESSLLAEQFRFAAYSLREHPSCQAPWILTRHILIKQSVNDSINFIPDRPAPPDLRRHPIPIVKLVIVFLLVFLGRGSRSRWAFKKCLLPILLSASKHSLSPPPNRLSFCLVSVVHFLKGCSLMASSLPRPTVYQSRSMSCLRNSFPSCSFSIF